MKTINVSYEDLAKTIAIAICGVLDQYGSTSSNKDVIELKNALQHDLEKHNSIEQSVKNYDEVIAG